MKTQIKIFEKEEIEDLMKEVNNFLDDFKEEDIIDIKYGSRVLGFNVYMSAMIIYKLDVGKK